MARCIESIEAINEKFDRIIENNDSFSEEVEERYRIHYEAMLKEFLEYANTTTIDEIKRKYSIYKKNSTIIKFARDLYEKGILTESEVKRCQEAFCLKKCKSHSGVLVVTIFTSGNPSYINEMGEQVTQRFSCKWNCYYCPNEPGQPRSYLKGEPGVLRANANEFDCCSQMWSRMSTLYDNGHPVDKLEVLVLGGTWESYPALYQEQYIRDMYYAANTFWETCKRERYSLEMERDMNRDADCKIIGLTLETRPDTINEEQIIRARRFGCTRFQIGIQHLDNDVLKKINRKCTTKQTIKAIQLLKDWGYKVDGHWMPNLPGATPELDWDMFNNQLLKQNKSIETIMSPVEGIDDWQVWDMSRPDLQLDQWKIYPCEVVPFTVIEKWFKEGKFIPYGEDSMTELLLETKKNMLPWIRLNRIIRDIPMDYIIASGDQPNMRQNLQVAMRKRGYRCHCIRCREVKLNKFPEKLIYRVRQYNASNGTEYFISAEDEVGHTLCGFVRLRLGNDSEIAWIRELHVYGKLQTTTKTSADAGASQHRGIGKQLMQFAYTIATMDATKTVMKVIAGEGTKRYYEKLGYMEGLYGYMEKLLK